MADYQGLLPNIEKVWSQIGKHKKQLVGATPFCTTSDYVKDDRKKYQQVRFNNTKYYVHIIAAMIQEGRAPAPGEEASHLCHFGDCVTPDHLCFENGEINKTRSCCKMFCHVDGYVCPHVPSCLGARALMRP